MVIDKECSDWIKERYKNDNFNEAVKEYNNLKDFKICDNVETVGGISEDAHTIMKLVSQFYMEKVFSAMKIDMNDPNVSGEKGTPYRFVKMYCGNDLHDETELLSGRWANRPRMASFPNEDRTNSFPIIKKVDLVSVCSHHTAPFSTMFRPDSYAVVAYIPEDTVLGISKLQRIVDWVSRRGHLQENLTKMIFDEVSKAANTQNVIVILNNIVHTCESLRGAQSKDGSFTSEYYGGVFLDADKRRELKQSIKN